MQHHTHLPRHVRPKTLNPEAQSHKGLQALASEGLGQLRHAYGIVAENGKKIELDSILYAPTRSWVWV